MHQNFFHLVLFRNINALHLRHNYNRNQFNDAQLKKNPVILSEWSKEEQRARTSESSHGPHDEARHGADHRTWNLLQLAGDCKFDAESFYTEKNCFLELLN